MNPSPGFFAEVAIHVFWVHTRATVLDKISSSMQCNSQKEASVYPALRSFLEFRISGFQNWGNGISDYDKCISTKGLTLSDNDCCNLRGRSRDWMRLRDHHNDQNFPNTALVRSGLCLISYEGYEKAFLEQRH